MKVNSILAQFLQNLFCRSIPGVIGFRVQGGCRYISGVRQKTERTLGESHGASRLRCCQRGGRDGEVGGPSHDAARIFGQRAERSRSRYVLPAASRTTIVSTTPFQTSSWIGSSSLTVAGPALIISSPTCSEFGRSVMTGRRPDWSSDPRCRRSDVVMSRVVYLMEFILVFSLGRDCLCLCIKIRHCRITSRFILIFFGGR